MSESESENIVEKPRVKRVMSEKQNEAFKIAQQKRNENIARRKEEKISQ